MFGIKSFVKALGIIIRNHFFFKLRGPPSKIGVFGKFYVKKIDFCQKPLFLRGVPLIFFKNGYGFLFPMLLRTI